MIHIWEIDAQDNLVINITELLKYPLLANIYRNDQSTEKYMSKEYFKYIDFITAASGYCVKNGLNDKDAHAYALSQTRLPKEYVFPKNNKEIIRWIKTELEYDVITRLVNTAVKALNVSTRSLECYIDSLNNLETKDFLDDEGNPINVADIVNKVLKTISAIPGDIDKLKVLIDKQQSSKQVIRGSNEYRTSMDGDGDIERYISDEEQ